MKRIREDNTYPPMKRRDWIIGSIVLWLVYGILFLPIYAFGWMFDFVYMCVICHTTVTICNIMLVCWVQE